MLVGLIAGLVYLVGKEKETSFSVNLAAVIVLVVIFGGLGYLLSLLFNIIPLIKNNWANNYLLNVFLQVLIFFLIFIPIGKYFEKRGKAKVS